MVAVFFGGARHAAGLDDRRRNHPDVDSVLCAGFCNLPSAVAVDLSSRCVLIADTYNNRVLRYGPASALTSTSQPLGGAGLSIHAGGGEPGSRTPHVGHAASSPPV